MTSARMEKALRSVNWRRFRDLESLVTTTVVGRDQGHPAKPWVEVLTIEVETTGVGIVEFDVDDAGEEALYQSGRAAAEGFVETRDFEAYKARFRAAPRTEVAG
jgi:NTE family protein